MKSDFLGKLLVAFVAALSLARALALAGEILLDDYTHGPKKNGKNGLLRGRPGMRTIGGGNSKDAILSGRSLAAKPDHSRASARAILACFGKELAGLRSI